MMNENNYHNQNHPQDEGPVEVSYYPMLEPDRRHTGKRRKALMKVLGSILALGVVSASSIGVYIAATGGNGGEMSTLSSTYTTDHNPNGDNSSPLTDDGDSSSGGSSSIADSTSAKSLVELASRSNALSIPEIVQKVTPSVVGISSIYEVTVSGNPLEYFYGGGGTQTQQNASTGTGIVMSADGYIITNNHVISGNPKKIIVTLNDGDTNEYEATVVGSDAATDLAVIKIQRTDLTPAEFGSSDDLEVGELAIAIGNPLGLELNCSVTAGIISATNRTITLTSSENSNQTYAMTLLQTDAAINPGNSGGPLVNSYGQVIGINNAKISMEGVEGLGFAIPINVAQPILNDFMSYGYVTGRPLIGITNPQDVDVFSAYRYGWPQGVLVGGVSDNAAAAGIKAGDIIVAANGQNITTTTELNKVKDGLKVGDTLTLRIFRPGQLRGDEGQYIDCKIVLVENTAHQQ